MATLAPLVKDLPGFERGRINWISFPCDACAFPSRYALKVEPAWDACDGRAGTWGWDPVRLQLGLPWSGTPKQLLTLLRVRFRLMGWVHSPLPPTWGGAWGWTWQDSSEHPTKVFDLVPLDHGEWQGMFSARPVAPLVDQNC
jgi:hypothetical protein